MQEVMPQRLGPITGNLTINRGSTASDNHESSRDPANSWPIAGLKPGSGVLGMRGPPLLIQHFPHL
jgi:hypothetical protein